MILLTLVYSDCIRFCFGPLINKQLLQFTTEWNHHRIHYSRMAEVPSGIPEVLFNLPEIHGEHFSIFYF